MIDATVLGTFDVRLDGRSIAQCANKPRQVLAMLVLDAPRVVSIDTLVDELWGALPPRSALTTLQTYVMQLRRAIEAAGTPGDGLDAKAVLETRYAGYRLALDPDRIDLNAFHADSRAGLQALELGDPATASRLLGRALDAWHGAAIGGVEHGRRLSVEATRIREDALSALIARVEADLQLGRHAQAVGELAVLADEHPLDERLSRLLMLACYRSGRAHRSLEAYGALRRSLVDELGMEPSLRVRDLHQQILESDPRLEWTPNATAPEAAADLVKEAS